MNKLYRRNNNGAPTVWWAELDSGTNSITVFYGLVRGNIRKEVYAVTQKDGQKELESRYNDKIKQGYIYLNELCDMQGLPPVEDGDNDTLFNFLNTYLPKDLSNGNSNLLLPMLAKTYNGNVWKKSVVCMVSIRLMVCVVLLLLILKTICLNLLGFVSKVVKVLFGILLAILKIICLLLLIQILSTI